MWICLTEIQDQAQALISELERRISFNALVYPLRSAAFQMARGKVVEDEAHDFYSGFRVVIPMIQTLCNHVSSKERKSKLDDFCKKIKEFVELSLSNDDTVFAFEKNFEIEYDVPVDEVARRVLGMQELLHAADFAIDEINSLIVDQEDALKNHLLLNDYNTQSAWKELLSLKDRFVHSANTGAHIDSAVTDASMSILHSHFFVAGLIKIPSSDIWKALSAEGNGTLPYNDFYSCYVVSHKSLYYFSLIDRGRNSAWFKKSSFLRRRA
jgi:hypothetical protein